MYTFGSSYLIDFAVLACQPALTIAVVLWTLLLFDTFLYQTRILVGTWVHDLAIFFTVVGGICLAVSMAVGSPYLAILAVFARRPVQAVVVVLWYLLFTDAFMYRTRILAHTWVQSLAIILTAMEVVSLAASIATGI